MNRLRVVYSMSAAAGGTLLLRRPYALFSQLYYHEKKKKIPYIKKAIKTLADYLISLTSTSDQFCIANSSCIQVVPN